MTLTSTAPRLVWALTLVSLTSLTACSSLSRTPDTASAPPSNTGVDGVACVGELPAIVPAGLIESSNPVLQAKAQLPSTKGGVCAARVLAVTAPVLLYRVFDAHNPHSKLGGWWSLNKPTGSREDYRAANAICKEWSPLDVVVSCELRPGTQIVVGNTQSASCADGSTYPKTANLQVFVPNDGRAGIVHVGACGPEASWPQ